MHTAYQLDEALFEITIDGRAASRAELLREWGPLHRLGVVAHEAYAPIGASFLLQLAMTAFYDTRPARKSKESRVYPDVFIFHVGGRFGDHGSFDVYPGRKEIFVDNHPQAILDAVNDRGITHLVVPDRAPEPVQHGWKEPTQALDRLVAAWAYSPSGRVADGDVTITVNEPRGEANTRVTLGSTVPYEQRQKYAMEQGVFEIPDNEIIVLGDNRVNEVDPEVRKQILADRANLRTDAGWTETYRTVAPADAICMLHRGPAPEFVRSPTLTELVEHRS